MAKKLKFPQCKSKITVFPNVPKNKKSSCPMCGKKGVFEPNSFATIDGGALRREGASASMDSRMEGFFSLGWHGAHTDMKGQGEKPDTWANIDLARDCADGQFEMYFCSTDCLRAFLNACVDELEKRIKPI